MAESKSKPEPKDEAPVQESEENTEENTEAEVQEAQDEVTEVLDEEQGQGFRGTEVDLTPNENYTVQGVTSGADVPEAHANKTTAQAKATNPLVQHPLSDH